MLITPHALSLWGPRQRAILQYIFFIVISSGYGHHILCCWLPTRRTRVRRLSLTFACGGPMWSSLQTMALSQLLKAEGPLFL